MVARRKGEGKKEGRQGGRAASTLEKRSFTVVDATMIRGTAFSIATLFTTTSPLRTPSYICIYIYIYISLSSLLLHFPCHFAVLVENRIVDELCQQFFVYRFPSALSSPFFICFSNLSVWRLILETNGNESS